MSSNYFIFILCLCVLRVKSENVPQFFNGITIKIYRNETPVTILRADTINNEPDATEIIVEDENIPTLKSGSFNSLTKLKYISLKRNDIAEVEAGAFKDLPKLRTINLNFNFITRISENVFADLPITKLYLRGNGIQILDAFAFKNLTYLETLDLSSNNIETLPGNLFYQTKNVRYINLNFNHLREGLTRGKIYYTGYFEEAFSNNVVDEHSVLDLSDNNFTLVDNLLFQGIQCVKHILLANNKIKTIKDYAFRDFIYVDFLDLAGNYLEELPDTIMEKLKHIKDINLENNPWKRSFVCKYEWWCTKHNKTNTIDMNCIKNK